MRNQAHGQLKSLAQEQYNAKMVLAKSKNAVGLGNSLMNDRFGRGKGSDRRKVSAGIRRTDQNGQSVCPVPWHVAPKSNKITSM